MTATASGPPTSSYLVCALPRSGGRTLAATIRAAGPVTAPEPCFWPGWRGHDLRTRQELRRCATAGAVPVEVLERIRGTVTGADGRFGAEVQWPELLRLARSLPGPDPQGGGGCGASPDHERLGTFLPSLRYVHLTREDKAAQALAWWRARHARDRSVRPVDLRSRTGVPDRAAGPLHLDPAVIEQLERRLVADEWRWVSFFARTGITPLVVSYEDLTADPDLTVRRLLRFLGAEPVEAPTRRRTDVGCGETVDDDGLRWLADYAAWRDRRRTGERSRPGRPAPAEAGSRWAAGERPEPFGGGTRG